MAKLDDPIVAGNPKETKRYVTIPEKDMFDTPHPNIQINNEKYEPGRHYVDKDVADTLEDRIGAVHRGNLRLMQPKRDANAEHLAQRGVGSATTNF